MSCTFVSFFKQKTAYELRISDWSSDVCSSDLANGIILGATLALGAIGLTLTYNILRFANFAHGEFLTFGAYFALVFASLFASGATLGPLTFGWEIGSASGREKVVQEV